MRLINILGNKNISFKRTQDYDATFLKKWELNFANTLTSKDKKSIYLDHFLWHVFSFEKLPFIQKQDAKIAFNSLEKNSCYVFYQHDDLVIEIENAENIAAEDFDNEEDVYVVDKDFTWTYIHTHESSCGPYFYCKKD